ncbi:MAG: hypothetical protein GXP38_03990 [Chloroflexi bacterium]|nr:hypothetical protein [Chloroflexota bacterium]
MFRPQTITLQCPHCGFSYQASLHSIIDVQSSPELKQLFLSGQLNASQCPNCGQINAVATPIVYHDAEHEFLGVFIPTQLKISEAQRQQTIGELTKALMDALPPEKRRGYMLTPKEFFSQEKMAETILGFDGITPEMIAASRKKFDILQKLVALKDDDTAFQTLVNDNQSYLDAEFFNIFAEIIKAAESSDAEEHKKLVEAREKLLPLTEIGRRILKQREAVMKLEKDSSRKNILQTVLESDEDQVEAIAVVARPALDYQFFAELAEHIERASDEERKQLEKKRDAMLKVLDVMRKEEEQAVEAGVSFLQEILAAENMEEAVIQNLPYFDSFILSLLAANIEEAKARGDEVAVQKLGQLWDTITKVLDQALPPEAKLLTSLLHASYPDETRQILQAHKAELTDSFWESVNKTIEALEASGDENSKASVRHLRNIVTQAKLL